MYSVAATQKLPRSGNNMRHAAWCGVLSLQDILYSMLPLNLLVINRHLRFLAGVAIKLQVLLIGASRFKSQYNQYACSSHSEYTPYFMVMIPISANTGRIWIYCCAYSQQPIRSWVSFIVALEYKAKWRKSNNSTPDITSLQLYGRARKPIKFKRPIQICQMGSSLLPLSKTSHSPRHLIMPWYQIRLLMQWFIPLLLFNTASMILQTFLILHLRELLEY